MTEELGGSVATVDATTAAPFTSTEIAQQPALWRDVGESAVEDRDADVAFCAPLLARPELRIVLAGAGTSAFAGQVVAPFLRRTLRRRVDAVATTDIVADPRGVFAEDVPTLLVSFARSGDSPESIAATELATELLTECFHLIVTCNETGSLSKEHRDRAGSHVVLMPPAANDRGFAMTSSFTCMTLAVLLRVGGLDPAVVPALADAAESVLRERRDAVRELAARRPSRLVVLGSGSLLGLAEESALKVLELTAGAVTATAESALGFRHGPKAVLTSDTVAVVYVSNDPYTRLYDLDIVRELQQTMDGGELVVVSAAAADGTSDDVPAGVTTWTLPGLDAVPDAALALPAVLHAQLLGLELSLGLGRTPDNPFPGGEVNRVVQGVRLHPLDPTS